MRPKNVEPGNKGIRKRTQTKTGLFNHTSNYLINNMNDDCFDIWCPNLNHVVDYLNVRLRIMMHESASDRGGVGSPRR